MRLIKFLKSDPNYIAIICLFIIWKVLLLFVLIGAFEFIPLYSKHLLGGGYDKYLTNYYSLPWANFDGEHFIALAQFGYQQYTHAFFPLYSKIISLARYYPDDNTLLILVKAGLFVSGASLAIALIFFYKLLKLDYSKEFSLGVILVLLLYPASFYFNAVYSESLFLMLIIGSFYFFRTKRFFWASLFGFFASLTRVFGVLLFLSFLIEIFIYKVSPKKSYWILLIPLGLISYMIYLKITVGDPLAFYNLQLIVGEQHQRGIILFPQVIYRYLRIILNVDTVSPLLTTILFELATGIIFLLLPIIGLFKKVRLSYLFFAFAGFLLPTIQGSFSSLPRYVLILFPSFIVLSLMIKNLPFHLKILLGSLSLILLIIEAAFFLRGYWVA